MIAPRLLLQPNASRDGDGAVALTTTGSVSIGAGRFSQAWLPGATGSYVQLASATHADADAGAILVRGSFGSSTSQQYLLTWGTTTNARLNVSRLNATTLAIYLGSAGRIVPFEAVPGELVTIGVRWTPGDYDIWVNGERLADGARTGTINGPSGGNLRFGAVSGALTATAESVLVVSGAPTDRWMAAWTQLPRQWSWSEVAGTGEHLNRPRGTGAFAVSAELWRADRFGNLTERVESRYPVQGSIGFNENTSTKWSLSLSVNDPQVFQPYRDFLVPVLTLTRPDGTRRTRRMGHFVALMPTGTITPARRSGTVEGKGIEYLLELDTLDGGLAVEAGTDPGEAAHDIAIGGGFLPNQLNLPPTGAALISEMYFDPGTSRLAAMNDLYNAAGFYTVWSTHEGVLTTMPYQNLADVAASVRYSTHEGAIRLVGAIEDDPDISRVRNRVTVRNIAPEQEPIYATVEVTNPAHPLHRDHVGIVIAETIDDPDVTSEAAARKRAEAFLAEGASYYRKMTIQTVLDLDIEAHQIIELDVPDDLDDLSGRWWRHAWSVELHGAQGITTHEINRVEQWQ